MKLMNAPKKTVVPTSKKTELKASPKVNKVAMPRLAANHNEILLSR